MILYVGSKVLSFSLRKAHWFHEAIFSDICTATFSKRSFFCSYFQERDQTASKLYTCPHCNRSFKGLNYFRFHVKGHSGKLTGDKMPQTQ